MSLTLNPVTLATADPDLLHDLLAPAEPHMMREVASFHANALLRHLITLMAEGEAENAYWRADVQSSLMAMMEVLGG